MTPGFDNGHKPRRVPFKGTALWLVAAVMLVLQGVAAGVVSVSGLGSEASSALGAASRGMQPGAMPRDVPKSFSDSAVVKKARANPWLLDGPPQALPVHPSFSLVPSRAVSHEALEEDAAPRGTSSPFQARAPPALLL
jgi:hypothetical protein